MLRPCGREFFKSQIDQLTKSDCIAHIEKIGSQMLLQRSVELVDAQFPSLIQQMQHEGYKFIALTALFTGKFGLIPSMEDWRYKELDQLGFHFSSTFPNYNHIVFGEFLESQTLPIFKNGILFSSHASKGDVLKAFLAKIKWHPKKILFIDDTLSFVESVNHAMETLEIECLAIHYRNHLLFSETLDHQKAKKQIAHLVEYEEWIDDTLVDELVDHSVREHSKE